MEVAGVGEMADRIFVMDAVGNLEAMHEVFASIR